MTATTTDTDIRLFIAPITAPTRGRWIAPGSPEDIRDEMERVRDETGAEELRISDAEGLPSNLIPKYGGVPVEKIGAFLTLAEMYRPEAARAYVEMFGRDVDAKEWAYDLEERYIGIYRSVEEYAQERLEFYDRGDLPRRYLDAAAMKRDLEASGDIHTRRLGPDEVLIFRGNL